MKLIAFLFLFNSLLVFLFGLLENTPMMILNAFMAILLWSLIVRELED